MRLGVCYHPEQWQEEQWKIDARSMRDLGLRIVRIGEFSWNKIEPSQGSFQWKWLDTLIESLSTEGLQIVLSTPVSNPPAWLWEAMEEIILNSKHANHQNNSSTQQLCPNHPFFKELTYSLISEMAKRYGTNPAVIGWQINEEPGFQECDRCQCEYCNRNYRSWLQQKYESLDNLNQSWGTSLWSQPIIGWEQIFLPSQLNRAKNPASQIDLKRYYSESVMKFLKFQTDIIRPQAPSQFITYDSSFNCDDVDFFQLGQELNLASWSSYPTFDAEQMTPGLYSHTSEIPDFVYDIGDPYITGFFHRWVHGIKHEPFWVMEQQCGQVDFGKINTGIRFGALRLWTWHAVSCGAEAILFSKWRAARFTENQFSAGILRHDGTPDLGYQEISNMLPELPVLLQLDEETVPAQVAILISYDDLWALGMQPHSVNYSYRRMIFNYYRVLTSLGILVDITSIESNLSEYRLIIAPGLFLSDEKIVSKLEAYVAQGGVVLFGARSGVKNKSNIVIEDSFPGLLTNLVGAQVHSWQALPEEVRFRIRSDISGLGGDAGVWIEAIHPEEDEGVNVLSRYLGGPLAGKACFTEHPFGAGNVYYLGFYPTFEQLKAILKYLIQHEGCGTILDLPDGVIVNQRGNHRVAFNFTRNEKAFVLDDKLITLPPRDFRYFLRDWN